MKGNIMLQKFFNPDHPINHFFSIIFCMIYLNLIWFVCCLPIITIGPATCALYYTMLHVVNGDDTSLTKYFFFSFKQNLKQGMFLGIIMTFLGALITLDVFFYIILPGKITSIFQVFQLVIVFYYLLILTWMFALLAKFHHSSWNIMKYSFFLSIKYIGYSIIMLVMEISIFLIMFFYVPLLALWGMGLISYVNSILFSNIFKKYSLEEPQCFSKENDEK